MTGRSLVLVGLVLGAMVVGVAPTAGQQAATTTLDEDSLPLAVDEQQVLRGETSLTPGTEVRVRLRSADSDTPFLKQETVTVTERGTFAATFDMSAIPVNTSYDITVDSDGQTLIDRTETVAACDGDCTDTVPDQPDDMPTGSENVFTAEQGDVVEIPVSTDGTAIFSFGDESVNYQLNASLTDGDGDGEVRVRLDTAVAGTDGQTLSVADASDSLTITRPENELGATLDAASYTYRVFRSSETSGTPDEVGTVVIEANESADEEFDGPSEDIDEQSTLGFEQSIYSVSQGQIAQISVTMGSSDAATVAIGGGDSGYAVTATVRDGNADGVVTVRFDTLAAGQSSETLSTADEADSVTIEQGSETQRETTLEPTDLDLRLSQGGETVDIGTLSIQDGASTVTPTDQTESTPSTTTDSDTSSMGVPGIGVWALVVGGMLAIGGAGLVLRSLWV